MVAQPKSKTNKYEKKENAAIMCVAYTVQLPFNL